MTGSNYDDAIEVAEDIYWVGRFDESEPLHCNPYLIIDAGEGVLIDPGSFTEFPVVMRKVIDVLGPNAVSTIVVSHQDPDVCGNVAVVEEIIDRDDLKIAAHSTTVRLIRHLGICSEFFAVDQNDYHVNLKSGRRLDFVYTPFLHSPGAIATFDSKTGTLFSGDIFGTIGVDWSLYAGPGYPENMRTFHESYMPSQKTLAAGMESFEKLDPERICPQHGSIIEKRFIATGIDFLKNLPCGVDLIGG